MSRNTAFPCKKCRHLNLEIEDGFFLSTGFLVSCSFHFLLAVAYSMLDGIYDSYTCIFQKDLNQVRFCSDTAFGGGSFHT
jgi:hypothetical protein